MEKSSINPAVLQQVLDSAANAAELGQSQFFTPLPFGRAVCAALSKFRGTIVDLNCGAAHLLHAAANDSTTALLGSDIDPIRSASRLAPDASRQMPVVRLTHDLTLLYPLLREVRFAADLFVLNPPWSLAWHRDRLADLATSELPAVRQAFKSSSSSSSSIDSTIATLMIALDLCTDGGEGVLIANEATLQRLIFGTSNQKPETSNSSPPPFAALAQHIWAHVTVPGNPMTGIDTCNWEPGKPFHTGVIYFARGHTTGPKHYQLQTSNFEPETSFGVERLWRKGPQVYEHLASIHTRPVWQAVKEHVASLGNGRPHSGWNLWLSGGLIQVHLSRFEERSVKVDQNEAGRLHALQGKSPMQLAIQRNEREELVHVAREAGWRVHPDLLAAIDDAIRQYHAARAPLYPLSRIMRLGYLDEQDTIVCEHDLFLSPPNLKPQTSNQKLRVSKPIFQKGIAYPIRTQTVQTERTAEKPNATTGLPETQTYTGQELAIYLKTGDGDDDPEYVFVDARLMSDDTKVGIQKVGSSRCDDQSSLDFNLQQLADHFFIPEVPDVASVNPDGYARNIAALTGLEQLTGSRLKGFQKEDLARGALHDGLILGWDTGLGKTWSLFLFPLLKCGFQRVVGSRCDDQGQPVVGSSRCDDQTLQPNGPVLILAPGDLHKQISDEARDRFQLAVTPLDSQDTFHRLVSGGDGPLARLDATGRPVLAPGFYITSYTQLTTNGVQKLPDPDAPGEGNPRALLEYLALPIGDTHQVAE